jgi:hypothetical protein
MPAAAVIARTSARVRAGARRLASAGVAHWIGGRRNDRLRDSVRELQTCQDALRRFGLKSDTDFTALARGLGHLNKRLADLRTQAEQLDLILEDRDEDRAISSANALYRSSVDLVHASMGTALSEQDQIRGIEESLLRACRARDEFKRNHLLLRILTMTIRMEASRMTAEYQGVFLNVAAAIGEIGEKIADNTESAFARIEAVIIEAQTERHNLKDLEENLLGRAHGSIQRIERELEALKVLLQPCVEQSRGIAELFTGVGPATLRTLASLQHQDVVRQQLEQVAGSFDDIRRHLDGNGPSGQPEASIDRAFVHRAASSQLANLRTARAGIEKAVNDVTSGLQAVLSVGGRLVTQFTAMEAAGRSAFHDCHVAQLFREEIGQLAHIANMSEKANDKISSLVDRIADVVRVFSQEISHYEIDVKIVALNAQIAAARLPSADALNKLAEETSVISAENAGGHPQTHRRPAKQPRRPARRQERCRRVPRHRHEREGRARAGRRGRGRQTRPAGGTGPIALGGGAARVRGGPPGDTRPARWTRIPVSRCQLLQSGRVSLRITARRDPGPCENDGPPWGGVRPTRVRRER